ncbi:hypothetical protein NP233_g761 [Leucocoprinus birnbaumii]|uniref:Uncharacterized protein n=1 Tax=Leucocoprinus birnbaumii TaxID=56174 RepID=A0AAD5YWG2_9AGAR|nr:hypothetical protein NP233_g761 [Leucocoprinus birnbaumii]
MQNNPASNTVASDSDTSDSDNEVRSAVKKSSNLTETRSEADKGGSTGSQARCLEMNRDVDMNVTHHTEGATGANLTEAQEITVLSALIAHHVAEQVLQKVDQRIEERITEKIAISPTPKPLEIFSPASANPASTVSPCNASHMLRPSREGAQLRVQAVKAQHLSSVSQRSSLRRLEVPSEAASFASDASLILLKEAKTELHSEIKDYLRGKCLWYGDAPNTYPTVPSQEAVREYETKANPRYAPNISTPRFDWSRTFASSSSRWNSDLLYQLSTDFHSILGAKIDRLSRGEIAEGETARWRLSELPEGDRTVQSLHRILEERLRKAKYKYNGAKNSGLIFESESLVEEKPVVLKVKEEESAEIPRKVRVRDRKKALFQLRSGIITTKLQANKNPEFWSGIGRLLTHLGEEGMSEDETDTERVTAGGPMVVNRLKPGWRNVEITSYMDFIDASGDQSSLGYTRHLSMKTKNRSKNKTRGVPRGLPKNYYSAQWLKKLEVDEKHSLGIFPAEDFPEVTGNE